jgi:hypothetical protein
MDQRISGATGKSGRVGVEQSNTSTQSLKDTQAGVEILACKEATCEDNNVMHSPEVSTGHVAKSIACTIKSRNAIEIVDLYSVGHPHTSKPQLENGEAIPFIHRIELEGPQGEIVRIRALFDDGAMVSAMCTSIFEKVKHRLHNWSTSDRRLRMANGSVVKAVAKWTGTIRIEGVKVRSTFEVFNSGGSWGFLFGKPTLKTFNATHEYTTDTISISDDTQTIRLSNQIADRRMLQRDEAMQLTLDEKQQRTENIREKARSRTKPENTPMGQWKHTKTYMRQEETRRTKEDIQGSEKLPSREVTMPIESEQQRGIDTPNTTEQSVSINVLTTTEEEENQLLAELPEIEQ